MKCCNWPVQHMISILMIVMEPLIWAKDHDDLVNRSERTRTALRSFGHRHGVGHGESCFQWYRYVFT